MMALEQLGRFPGGRASPTKPLPSAIWSVVSLGGRPKRTPRGLAATRPLLVRRWISAR